MTIYSEFSWIFPLQMAMFNSYAKLPEGRFNYDYNYRWFWPTSSCCQLPQVPRHRRGTGHVQSPWAKRPHPTTSPCIYGSRWSCILEDDCRSISHMLHGIFTYMTGWFSRANVGKYSIHGAYGYGMLFLFRENLQETHGFFRFSCESSLKPFKQFWRSWTILPLKLGCDFSF